MKKIAIYGSLVLLLCLAGVTGAVYLKHASQSNVGLGKKHKAQQGPSKPSGKYRRTVDYVFGSHHDLKLSTYQIFKKGGPASGGGLALIGGNRVLLMTGGGTSYVVTVDGEDIRLEALNINPPLAVECYVKSDPCGKQRWYRVTDIMLEPGNGPERLLYAATTHWDRARKCYTLRLSEAKINFETKDSTEWTVRFESAPCIEVLLGNESGGRLAFLNDKSILMTTGQFGAPNEVLNKDPDFQYGKVIEIDRDDWTSRIFTRGHRNPQGLLVDGREVWETEHGPQGGDELNLLTFGNDYGWPRESYGTDYGQKSLNGQWPGGDHSHSTRPFYAWTPSIGISNLIRIRGDAFESWKGDLFVASKNGRSLFRVRIREGRVILAERLETGQRIEALVELPDGRIVLWSGWNRIQVVAPGDQVFSSCIGCHSVYRHAHGIGPDLMGVVGSKVARHKTYAYSDAMIDFGGKWTRERLDQFLADPQATVPGTAMEFAGIADPDKRKKIIDYLQQLTVPGTTRH